MFCDWSSLSSPSDPVTLLTISIRNGALTIWFFRTGWLDQLFCEGNSSVLRNRELLVSAERITTFVVRTIISLLKKKENLSSLSTPCMPTGQQTYPENYASTCTISTIICKKCMENIGICACTLYFADNGRISSRFLVSTLNSLFYNEKFFSV